MQEIEELVVDALYCLVVTECSLYRAKWLGSEENMNIISDEDEFIDALGVYNLCR
jgi:hypothetical protein